jgi:hypothetical protein
MFINVKTDINLSAILRNDMTQEELARIADEAILTLSSQVARPNTPHASERFNILMDARIQLAQALQNALSDKPVWPAGKSKETLTVETGDVPVSLYAYPKVKGRIQRYRVTYGQDIRENLDHANAAGQLGFSILHSLECAGKIDSSGGED